MGSLCGLFSPKSGTPGDEIKAKLERAASRLTDARGALIRQLEPLGAGSRRPFLVPSEFGERGVRRSSHDVWGATMCGRMHA